MINTINNHHSYHYNNSKVSKNIHKSDDKVKIKGNEKDKEKEENKVVGEIKKNMSQKRIVKNSDENKENKYTDNIKKDKRKKGKIVLKIKITMNPKILPKKQKK